MEEAKRRKIDALALLVVVDYEKERRRNKMRIWTREWLPRRNENRGSLALLFEELGPEDPKSFQNFTRLDDNVLEELLNLVTPLIAKRDTVMRQAITPHYRLATTLRFLATGNKFQDLSYSMRIGANTVSQIVTETLTAIVTALDQENVLSCPLSPEGWETVAGQFYAHWQFPHCIGALDGKHVNFCSPRAEGSRYRNYKGHDSIILLALVDANYSFMYVDVGCNGRMHDASAFRECSLYQNLVSGSLNLPVSHFLPGGSEALPYVIVADDAFPLKENIVKPYPGRGLTHEKDVFNYRLSRARRVAENAFGILSNRFRILLKPIPLSVEKVELITYTCCLLHNFLIKRKPVCHVTEEHQEIVTTGFQNITRNNGNRASKSAISIRNNFASYFCSHGAVPWQDRSVGQGDY